MRRSRSRLAWSSFLALHFALASLALGQEPPTREWSDASGTFRIEASLAGVGERTVRLRKTDGTEIEVPLDRLSAEDARLARSATAAAAEALARRQVEATKSHEIVAAFLADPSLPESEKILLRERLPNFQAAAEAGLRRVGADWLSPERFEEEAGRQREALADARQAYEAGEKADALAAIRKADRRFERGVEPAFEFATIAALTERDASVAQELLEDIVRRRLRDRDLLTPVERANLAAALNNLALVSLRLGRSSDAMSWWRSAVDLGVPTPELAHNLGRALRLASSPNSPLNAAQREQADNLLASVANAFPQYAFDARKGWLHSPIVPESFDLGAEPVIGAPNVDANLAIVGGVTGIVVAPGIVLTLREAIAGSETLAIRAGDAPTNMLEARVVATGDGDDEPFVLIECPRLAVPSATMATKATPPGEPLRRVGCLLSLRSSERLISAPVELRALDDDALATSPFRDRLLYDVESEIDLPGAPILDAKGAVVAIHARTLYPKGSVAFAAGFDAARAAKFVAAHLPADASTALPDAAASSNADLAAVQVLLLAARRPQRLAPRALPAGHASRGDYEDPWCMKCGGWERVGCPEKMCVKGMVPSTPQMRDPAPVKETVLELGANGKFMSPIGSGRSSGFSGPQRARGPCPTCAASGIVKCPFCGNGVDPSLPVESGG